MFEWIKNLFKVDPDNRPLNGGDYDRLRWTINELLEVISDLERRLSYAELLEFDGWNCDDSEDVEDSWRPDVADYNKKYDAYYSKVCDKWILSESEPSTCTICWKDRAIKVKDVH